MSTLHETLAQRLLMAGDLFETGVALKRQQIRRGNPRMSEEEVERRLAEWLRHRPGAEHGDAEGKVITWPRP
ncbi:MAG: hypothetical protein GEU99_17590 [Luteitalea sp.]|nr:hypothetical protein [Luteitalea sp.]